jgi:hypothetical protein
MERRRLHCYIFVLLWPISGYSYSNVLQERDTSYDLTFSEVKGEYWTAFY